MGDVGGAWSSTVGSAKDLNFDKGAEVQEPWLRSNET